MPPETVAAEMLQCKSAAMTEQDIEDIIAMVRVLRGAASRGVTRLHANLLLLAEAVLSGG